jgi:flagellar assembly factor FliW
MTPSTTTNHPGDHSEMAVTMHSTRFGQISIPSDNVLDFPHGLIGLPGTQFALLARSEDSAFLWLHSLEDPELALPVTNPWRFFSTYEVEISDDEAESLGIAQADQTSVYVTVRAAEELGGFTANLAAPILVNDGRGHQIINQAPDAPVRAPLFRDEAGPSAFAA